MGDSLPELQAAVDEAIASAAARREALHQHVNEMMDANHKSLMELGRRVKQAIESGIGERDGADWWKQGPPNENEGAT